jgi:hypothetical protein
MAAPNRYLIHLGYADAPKPWALFEDDPDAPSYVRGVLREMERRLGPRGLTVYVTWKLDAVPTTGDRVVAVVLGDEWARVPLYAADVLATFKCYGTRPALGRLPPDPGLALMLLAKHARTWAHGREGRRRYARATRERRARGEAVPPVYPIPLGYGNQLDLPVRPLAERATDLFFAGSVAHGEYPWYAPQRWLRSPKELARARMLAALETLRARRPEWRVRTTTTASFALNALHYGTPDAATVLGGDAYSHALMDTRLCLAPRGTSAETFRYFEGLRYGCVVLAEPQPPRPFYADAPVVEVTDWRRLEAVAAGLLADPARMERLHRAALAWWRTRCSEEAVGAEMAERVEALLPAETRGRASVTALAGHE